jgi:hypothetical protein
MASPAARRVDNTRAFGNDSNVPPALNRAGSECIRFRLPTRLLYRVFLRSRGRTNVCSALQCPDPLSTSTCDVRSIGMRKRIHFAQLRWRIEVYGLGSTEHPQYVVHSIKVNERRDKSAAPQIALTHQLQINERRHRQQTQELLHCARSSVCFGVICCGSDWFGGQRQIAPLQVVVVK